MESRVEVMERRFRSGGVCMVVVALLGGCYAMVLHGGSGDPPTYGLAVMYVLDWAGRMLDRIGGLVGRGWEETAFRINLWIAGTVGALGIVSWLGSRVNRLFAVFGILPRLGSRLVYLAAMALYLVDGLVAVGIEMTYRKMFSIEGFALSCIVVHAVVLALLLYCLATGLYGLWSGVKELFRFLFSPLRTLREARVRSADTPPSQRPPAHDEELSERLRKLAEGD